jgi:ATP-dependent RNA helicase RhlE
LFFENLNVIEPILRALKSEGYTNPTPIQQQAIPIVLEGRDLLGVAQTGTGKTAAFAIPVLQMLYNKNAGNTRHIQVLILTPTRELAIQIGESFNVYGRHTGINSLVIFGGVSQIPQVNAIRRGVDVLIATPGRLLDLINQRVLSIRDLEMFVLDEADRMLDMGFIHDVKRVVALLPANRQSLFFSATMPPEIASLAGTILRDPARVEVTPVSSTAEKIDQSLFYVEKPDKPNLLQHLLRSEEYQSVLVFTRTKGGSDKVAKFLNRAGITADSIHGEKSQNARQRALQNFKNGDIKVLVATDIVARGIDLESLSLVINYDLPNVPETYVHRIGRTGRAGAAGKAYSFVDYEERSYLKDLYKLIGRTIPVISEHPYHSNGARPQGFVPTSQGSQNRNNSFRRQNSPNDRFRPQRSQSDLRSV